MSRNSSQLFLFCCFTLFACSRSGGGGNTASAKLNKAPKAFDDFALTPSSHSVTINVLANDSDPDNDVLSILNVSSPAHGTASSVLDKQIFYQPQTNFVGNDTFSYTIQDGKGGVTSAKVFVTVQPNVAPNANNDLANTLQMHTVEIDVSANDFDINADLLMVTNFSQPSHGITTLLPNGKIQYQASDFIGSDSFNYTIEDGFGGSANAEVMINIGPNSSPTAANDAATTSLMHEAEINVLVNDMDIDGDSLSVLSIAPAANGTATIVDGKIHYLPNPNFIGNDSFTYTITDGYGGNATASVAVSVVLPNLNFGEHQDFSIGTGKTTLGVVSADFNGDSKPDIAVLVAENTVENRMVSIFLNTTIAGAATPTFSVRYDFPVTSSLISFPSYGLKDSMLAVGDINQDGRPDLIATEYFLDIFSVLLNTTLPFSPDASFSNSTDFSTSPNSWAQTVFAKDLNADGAPDVCIPRNVSSTDVAVFTNATQNPQLPNFSSPLNIGSWSFLFTALSEDFNSDGLPDIANGAFSANSGAGSLSVLMNNTSTSGGAVNLSSAVNFNLPGFGVISMKSADFNSDGKMDVVLLNTDYVGVWLSVFPNTTATNSPTPSFGSRVDITAETNFELFPVFVGDFDGDTRTDIAVVNRASDHFSLYINNTPVGTATPSFENKVDFNINTKPLHVVAVDINQDGKLDMVFGNQTDSISVVLNTTTP